MEKVKITVNGKEYYVNKDANLLQTLKSLDYYIPSLCYDDRLELYGSCRLCYVRVNGSLMPSCITKVKDGMTIITEDEEIIENRKTILDMVSGQISGILSKKKKLVKHLINMELIMKRRKLKRN